MESRYVKGQFNALCQRCGFVHKSGQIRKEWTGLMVCRECFETRSPQEHVQGRVDKQAPPWSSPEPADVFIVDQITGDDL